MRRIVVSTFLSLDGVMQASGAPGEDPSGGFDQEGWSVDYWDDRMGQIMDEFMGTGVRFDLLLGRKTYEIFTAHPDLDRQRPGRGSRAAPLAGNGRTMSRSAWPAAIRGRPAGHSSLLAVGFVNDPG